VETVMRDWKFAKAWLLREIRRWELSHRREGGAYRARAYCARSTDPRSKGAYRVGDETSLQSSVVSPESRGSLLRLRHRSWNDAHQRRCAIIAARSRGADPVRRWSLAGAL